MSHSVISWLAQKYTFFGINPIFVEKEAQLASAKTPRFDPTLLSAWTPVGTKPATHTEKNILPYAVHSAGIRIFAANL